FVIDDLICNCRLAPKDLSKPNCQNQVGHCSRSSPISVPKWMYPVQTPHQIGCQVQRILQVLISRTPMLINVPAHLSHMSLDLVGGRRLVSSVGYADWNCAEFTSRSTNVLHRQTIQFGY